MCKGEDERMKRKIALVCAAAMALSLAACGSTSSESTASSSEAASSESTAASSEAASSESTEAAAAGDFDATQAINVVSREDGSGTRGAFIELTGVEDDNGDNTTDRKSTRLNSSHVSISYAVFCLKKKKKHNTYHVYSRKQYYRTDLNV